MSTTTQEAPAQNKPTPKKPGSANWWYQALRRIHFYAGIFIGPFIFIAALTGMLYAVAPTAEKMIYSHELSVAQSDTGMSLTDQIHAANEHVGQKAEPVAVRPAPAPGDTTRVLYADENLPQGEFRTIFVNPGNGEILGDMETYGSSGAMPLRAFLSHLHSGAIAGDFGRYYSELAACWMWIIALAGIGMAFYGITKKLKKTEVLKPDFKKKGYFRTLSLHRAAGIWIAIFLLFFSATGITWSQLGGENVATLRQAMNWQTPTPSAELTPAETSSDSHADHADHADHSSGYGAHTSGAGMPSDKTSDTFEHILDIARTNQLIDNGMVEIKVPKKEGMVWSVREIRAAWPTQVDSVTVDPASHKIVDTVDFKKDYSVAAKLTRWGIDFHMGILFGVVNQLILVIFAAILMLIVFWGYKMWWQRRPRREAGAVFGALPPRGAWKKLRLWEKLLAVICALGLGIFLPLLGISLLIFVVIDIALGLRKQKSS